MLDAKLGREAPPLPTHHPHALRPSGGPAVLEVSQLTKSYGDVPVLRDLSFSVAEGEIFGVLGSNGAGKTTAVEIVQGLRPGDSGAISLFGLDPVRDRSTLRHLVGSQLQSSALPDRLRVGEALRLFTRLAGDVVSWTELRDRWGLGEIERRAFGALSGGQRQRLFLALAMVNRPRLVFLDELTQGLDAAARRQTWDLILQVRDEGSSVVLVTHFMDEAERLCDRIGVLHDGRMTFVGRADDLVTAVGGDVHIRFTVPDPLWLEGLDRVPGVTGLAHTGTQATVSCAATACVPLIAQLAANGLAPDDLAIVRPSLEDAFVALTQGAPR